MDNKEEKTAEESISFDEALERIGTGRCQYRIIIVGGIIMFSAYMAVGVMSYVITPAQCDLQMDSEKKGAIMSAVFIGIVCSCHLWGFLADTKGRRYILVRTLFCDVILYITTSLCPYYKLMFVLRILNGITSCASLSCIFSYVSEFLKSENRSIGVLVSCILASSSYIILPMTALAVIPHKWEIQLLPNLTYKPWRLYYTLSAVPSLLGCIMIYFSPESPKYLLAAGRHKEVIQVLRRIHRENHMEGEFNVKNIRINDNEKVAKLEQGRSKITAFITLVWRQTSPLFRPPLRVNMLLLLLLNFLLFFCNNGMYLWMPETVNRIVVFKNRYGNKTGTFCDVIESYSINLNITKSVMESENNGKVEITCDDTVDESVFRNIATVGIFQMSCLITVVLLLKIIKRKFVMAVFIFGAIIPSISLFTPKLFDYLITKMSLMVIVTAGVFPVVSSAVVDLIPTNVRSMASCLSQMSSRVATLVANLIAGMLIDKHCTVLVWLFIGALGTSFVISLLIPTKAKYLEENETKKPFEA